LTAPASGAVLRRPLPAERLANLCHLRNGLPNSKLPPGNGPNYSQILDKVRAKDDCDVAGPG
jgi:hypothetical protein